MPESIVRNRHLGRFDSRTTALSGAARAWCHISALAGYGALTIIYTFPLIFHLLNENLGYKNAASIWVWDLWHFRYALTVLHADPLRTNFIYWPYGANFFMQHGFYYRIVGFFLQSLISLTQTCNLLLLVNIVLSGYGVFLIASEWGAGWGAAFLAGALFAFSPDVAANLNQDAGLDVLSRQTLSFFLWAMFRVVRSRRFGDAVLAALCLTWIWGCNYYYFLFSLLLIPLHFLVMEKPFQLDAVQRPTNVEIKITSYLLNAVILLGGLWLAVSLRHGQKEFHGHGSLRDIVLYLAPYLLLWGLIAVRLGLKFSLRMNLNMKAVSPSALLPYVYTLASYTVMNLPLIVYLVIFLHQGQYGGPRHAWRGGGNATDVWDILHPSWYHPIWGPWFEKLSRKDAFNLGYVGLIPLVSALWLWRCRPKDDWVRLWFAGAIFSAVITLGPWLKIFGFHTYLPLPFYFLHLLPLYNNLQVGARFICFIMLFMALLFAVSLKEMAMRIPPRLAPWLPLIAFGGLALEFAHLPLPHSKLDTPPLFQRMGSRPYGAMLPIPVGAVFDGLDSIGVIGSVAMLPHYQIAHRKPIVGGELGRVSRRTYDQMKNDPFISALAVAQSGGGLPTFLRDSQAVRRYFQKMHLTYVVVFTNRTPMVLQEAITHWPVELIDQERALKLYLFRDK